MGASVCQMNRVSQHKRGSLRQVEWAARGSVRVVTEAAGMVFVLDDLDVVDPYDHFWTPLDTRVTVNEHRERHTPQTATMLGDVDGVPWSATVQSEVVKRPRRKGEYEGGWSRIVALEVGHFAVTRDAAERIADYRAWTAHTEPVEEAPDALALMPRATYAARGALVALEEARTFVSAVRHDEHLRASLDGFPLCDITRLPKSGRVVVVARLHNLATEYGHANPQARVMQATGLTKSTCTRYIAEARESGLVVDRRSK